MVSVTDTGALDDRRPQWPVLVATENYEIRVAQTQAEVEAAPALRPERRFRLSGGGEAIERDVLAASLFFRRQTDRLDPAARSLQRA